MAVDTREKRFSMLNFGDGSHSHATFEADGAVDLDDRQHLLDCYSGIAWGVVVVGGVDLVQRTVTLNTSFTPSLAVRVALSVDAPIALTLERTLEET